MTVHRPLAAGAILGLHAQTSLHPGSGHGLGTVDLPIHRERHTQWPCVPGSSLKGILRDACRSRLSLAEAASPRESSAGAGQGSPTPLTLLFGAPAPAVSEATGDADAEIGSPATPETAGALSLTDARLLAFPVRSLKGVFAWTTCPAALERFRRDAALAGIAVPWEIPAPPAHGAAIPEGSPCLIEGERIILEEYDFPASVAPEASQVADWIASRLLCDDPAFAAAAERFRRGLVVLSDDDFTHFAKHATEIVARIGLNYETKTARKGALFHQEFLPPETLLYSVVLANPARSRRGQDGASLLGLLDALLPSPAILQIGGEESIGKGYCAARLVRDGRDESSARSS